MGQRMILCFAFLSVYLLGGRSWFPLSSQALCQGHCRRHHYKRSRACRSARKRDDVRSDPWVWGYDKRLAPYLQTNRVQAKLWMRWVSEGGIPPDVKLTASDRRVGSAVLSYLTDLAAKDHDDESAEEYYRLAEEGNFEITVPSLTPFINKAARRGDIRSAEVWLRRAVTSNGLTNEVPLSACLNAAANAGNLSRAEMWLEWAELSRVDVGVVTYSTLIKAAGRGSDHSGALRWYHRAREAGVEPNVVMCAALVTAVRSDVEAAEHWFEVACQGRVEPNAVMYNAVIDSCARAGDMARAAEHLRSMRGAVEPSGATFGALINGAAERGDLELALSWFDEMERSGIIANRIVWNTLLKACINVRPRGQAQMRATEDILWSMVKDRGVKPDLVTLSYIGECLALAGCPRSARC
ncbi:unnamed protein product [Prorocentrum cordatum]|uniref:Pentatricopeptide repeat-containing protein-mitochondrial domain-containing protein n=1 Tax=Prorocentrum cordatum TaxID=2364126 RepID=A0ABN9UT71_9DINO|nr:unnamed protein product [Polarella glacialis]